MMSAIIYRSLPVVAALILLTFLFFMLRGKHIQHKYVYLWSILSFGVVVLAVFPRLAFTVSKFFGFETTSNFLLSVAVFILLLSSIAMSVDLSRKGRREEELVQSIALLENRVRDLESSEKAEGEEGE